MLYINTKFKVTGNSLEELTKRAIDEVRGFYNMYGKSDDEMLTLFKIELDISSAMDDFSHDDMYECTVYAKKV